MIASQSDAGNGLNTVQPDSLFEQGFCIEAGHPALPGHFPGHPLVPGVILLEQVALALRAWRRQRLARVLEAKFMASLLPGELAVVRLSASGQGQAPQETARVRFEIFRGESPLARGVIEGGA